MKDIKNIERVRIWQNKQKEEGLCIECTNETKDKSLRCEVCNKRRADKRIEKYNKWKLEGKCVICGKETLKNKNYCKKHYLQKISSSRLGTSKYWEELEMLLEKQNYRCALTNDIISFNDDIELDHILPKYRKGKDVISNVQWTTKSANNFKRYKTEIELFELCKKIYDKLRTKY